MAQNNYVLTADIGSRSLKMAEFLQDKGKLILTNFSYVEYSLQDTEEETKTIELQKALEEAIKINAFKAKKLYLSISGQLVFTRFVKLPISETTKQRRVEQLINYEAKQNIPFPLEEVTWDYQIIHSTDDKSGEVSVMFAVIKTDTISELVSVFENAGFETVLIGTSPTSTYNCLCAAKISESEPSAIINIGCKCTNIIFIDKGKFFARAIPLGGYSITHQISKEMNISFAEAEKLKRTNGYVSLGTNFEAEGSETDVVISKIIRNVMVRIHGEIVRSINVYKSQQPENKLSRIYLAGGSSVLKYTDNFLSEKLKLPVEYLNAFKLVSIAKDVNKHELAKVGHMFPELLGLAVNSITSCPIEISLLPKSVTKQHATKRKTPYFYAIIGIIIFNLGIFLWGLKTQTNLLVDLISNSTEQINKIQKSVNSISALVKDCNKHKQDYSELAQILDDRNQWFTIIDSIQKSLPDNSWITLLEPSGKPAISVTTTTRRNTREGSIFRSKRKYQKNVKTSTPGPDSVEWLKISINTLILFKSLKTTEAEDFKANLLKQPCFTDNSDEVVIIDYKTPIRDSDNISSFEIIIKLQNPISLNAFEGQSKPRRKH